MKGCVGVRAIKKNKYRGLGIQRVKVPAPPPPDMVFDKLSWIVSAAKSLSDDTQY